MSEGSTVKVRREARQSMALKLTPNGPVALIPGHLEADSEQVSAFISRALASLPPEERLSKPRPAKVVHELVEQWAERLGVRVTRVQVRPMRHKWGSVSTAGTLTLAHDLLTLPIDLVEYVVVHELLHLKFPNHAKGWQVSMGMYLPDWRERARRLGYWMVEKSGFDSAYAERAK